MKFHRIGWWFKENVVAIDLAAMALSVAVLVVIALRASYSAGVMDANSKLVTMFVEKAAADREQAAEERAKAGDLIKRAQAAFDDVCPAPRSQSQKSPGTHADQMPSV